MRRLSVSQLHALKVRELGLDATAIDLTSMEALSCAIRRMASFLCPCAAPTLIRGVVQPLRGLADDLASIKDSAESVLEAMISHGDIIEEFNVGENFEHNGVLLYAAPPSFVLRQSGVAILLGIASEHLSALPDELQGRIEYFSHIRRLIPQPGEDLRDELTQLGLIELSYSKWLTQPTAQSAAQHISYINQLLNSAPPSGDIPGLSILDPAHPVRYYRGRWVDPTSHSGKFVCRRTQAYGSDLWGYVEIENGIPRKFIDFPLNNNSWRGCDEAWWLQAAIDYERGTPQSFSIQPGPNGTGIFKFFSPVPMWARKRWNAVGEPVEVSGCLFAYKFVEDEVIEEISFLEDKLWLIKIDKPLARNRRS